MLTYSDPTRAARALGQAFVLAPYDFFWAGAKSQLSSQLWDYMDPDTKRTALREVRMLWEEPMLRDEILPLLARPAGNDLLTRAFASEPDTIRAINRFVSASRRRLQPKGA
jgi:hypothetical protein